MEKKIGTLLIEVLLIMHFLCSIPKNLQNGGIHLIAVLRDSSIQDNALEWTINTEVYCRNVLMVFILN